MGKKDVVVRKTAAVWKDVVVGRKDVVVWKAGLNKPTCLLLVHSHMVLKSDPCWSFFHFSRN